MLDCHAVIDSLQPVQGKDKAHELFNFLEILIINPVEMDRRMARKLLFAPDQRIVAIKFTVTVFVVLLYATCY